MRFTPEIKNFLIDFRPQLDALHVTSFETVDATTNTLRLLFKDDRAAAVARAIVKSKVETMHGGVLESVNLLFGPAAGPVATKGKLLTFADVTRAVKSLPGFDNVFVTKPMGPAGARTWPASLLPITKDGYSPTAFNSSALLSKTSVGTAEEVMISKVQIAG